MSREDEIAAMILELCRARGRRKTICPSEVARRIEPDRWRDVMADVRRVASRLAGSGQIEATQRGIVVDPATARGAIRLRIKPAIS